MEMNDTDGPSMSLGGFLLFLAAIVAGMLLLASVDLTPGNNPAPEVSTTWTP